MRIIIENLIGLPVINNTVTTQTTDALGNIITTITETGYDVEYILMSVLLIIAFASILKLTGILVKTMIGGK